MKTAKLFRKAAEAYYLAGKPGRAVENFERGDAVRANENGWKAHRLSGAVGLDDEVRRAILTSLIVDAPTEVALGDESQK